MSIESKVPAHWTDEQLIEYLYGVHAEDEHLISCEHCRERAGAMRFRRQAVEHEFSAADAVSFDFLAAQRRKIHTRLAEPVRWWQVFQVPRWAPTAAALVAMSAGVIVVKESHIKENHAFRTQAHSQQTANANVSDAQLAAEVSQLADDSEPSSTAPIQALFED